MALRVSLLRLSHGAAVLSWMLCIACGPTTPAQKENRQKAIPTPLDGKPFFDIPPQYAPYIDQLGFKVPQSRVREGLGTIQVRVIRFRPPRSPAAPKPPVFFLHGGPGGSIRPLANRLAQGGGVTLAKQWGRDILLLAQRGTEGADPFLRCNNDALCNDTDWINHEAYAEAGISVCSYNTVANADDVADIVQAMGYPQVVLYGHSYGTVLAQKVMQRHPKVVHSAILGGFFDRVRYDQHDAQDRILEETTFTWYKQACAKDPTCAQQAPGWDPRADYRNAPTVLKQKPLQIGNNTWTDQVFQTWVDRKLQQSLETGVYRVLAAMRAVAAGQFDQASALMRDEEFPKNFKEENPNLADVMKDLTNRLDKKAASELAKACGYSPEEFSAPFVSTGIPTLFLVGGLDRQTPAAWAREDHKKFTPFQYVEFPCANHSSPHITPILHTTRCGSSIAASFLQDPQKPVDTSCVKPTCDDVATQFAVDFSNTLQLISGP